MIQPQIQLYFLRGRRVTVTLEKELKILKEEELTIMTLTVNDEKDRF